MDETTAHTTWFIPETHYLESWGDCRAFDGTASLVQPLIEPLFQGHSLVEILALAAGDRTPVPRRLLEQAWKSRHTDTDFPRFWDAALSGGVIPNSAAPHLQLSLQLAGISQALESLRAAPPPDSALFDLTTPPDSGVYDGRFASNAWLQELPRPITKLTWTNAAYVAPATAGRLGLVTGDTIELARAGRTLTAGVMVAHRTGREHLHSFCGLRATQHRLLSRGPRLRCFCASHQ